MNAWKTVAETLAPDVLASSTFARLDAWFQAAVVLVDADPDFLKAVPRSAQHEVQHEPPFLFGEEFPDASTGWWCGGIVEESRQDRFEPVSEQQQCRTDVLLTHLRTALFPHNGGPSASSTSRSERTEDTTSKKVQCQTCKAVMTYTGQRKTWCSQCKKQKRLLHMRCANCHKTCSECECPYGECMPPCGCPVKRCVSLKDIAGARIKCKQTCPQCSTTEVCFREWRCAVSQEPLRTCQCWRHKHLWQCASATKRKPSKMKVFSAKQVQPGAQRKEPFLVRCPHCKCTKDWHALSLDDQGRWHCSQCWSQTKQRERIRLGGMVCVKCSLQARKDVLVARCECKREATGASATQRLPSSTTQSSSLTTRTEGKRRRSTPAEAQVKKRPASKQ